MEQTTPSRVVDLIYDKCQEILNSNPCYNKCSVMLSEIYRHNEGNQIVLTLIADSRTRLTEYRQSEIITLHTDIEHLMELLYNRTT